MKQGKRKTKRGAGGSAGGVMRGGKLKGYNQREQRGCCLSYSSDSLSGPEKEAARDGRRVIDGTAAATLRHTRATPQPNNASNRVLFLAHPSANFASFLLSALRFTLANRQLELVAITEGDSASAHYSSEVTVCLSRMFWAVLPTCDACVSFVAEK